MKKIRNTILMSLVFGFAHAQYNIDDDMHIYNFSDYRFYQGIVTAINPTNCTPVVQGTTAAYIYPGESTVYRKFQGSGASYIPINNWTVYIGTSSVSYNQSQPQLNVFETTSRWGGFLAEYLDAATLSYGENIQIGYGYSSSGSTCYDNGLFHTDSYINAYAFYVGTSPSPETFYLVIDNI